MLAATSALIDATAEALRGQGVEVLTGLLDVREPEALEAFYGEVDEAFGALHVLVNVVGGTFRAPFAETSRKGWEAIVRTTVDARLIHAALLAAGAKPGSPVQFVNPMTNEEEYKPASGTEVRVLVHYRKGGKLHTHPAQEWIWDHKKKATIPHQWVFAGSIFIKDPENPNAKPHYGANAGDIFSISNFPYSTLEFPVPISKDEAQLTYEARTGVTSIPLPTGSVTETSVGSD